MVIRDVLIAAAMSVLVVALNDIRKKKRKNEQYTAQQKMLQGRFFTNLANIGKMLEHTHSSICEKTEGLLLNLVKNDVATLL